MAQEDAEVKAIGDKMADKKIHALILEAEAPFLAKFVSILERKARKISFPPHHTHTQKEQTIDKNLSQVPSWK